MKQMDFSLGSQLKEMKKDCDFMAQVVQPLVDSVDKLYTNLSVHANQASFSSVGNKTSEEKLFRCECPRSNVICTFDASTCPSNITNKHLLERTETVAEQMQHIADVTLFNSNMVKSVVNKMEFMLQENLKGDKVTAGLEKALADLTNLTTSLMTVVLNTTDLYTEDKIAKQSPPILHNDKRSKSWTGADTTNELGKMKESLTRMGKNLEAVAQLSTTRAQCILTNTSFLREEKINSTVIAETVGSFMKDFFNDSFSNRTDKCQFCIRHKEWFPIEFLGAHPLAFLLYTSLLINLICAWMFILWCCLCGKKSTGKDDKAPSCCCSFAQRCQKSRRGRRHTRGKKKTTSSQKSQKKTEDEDIVELDDFAEGTALSSEQKDSSKKRLGSSANKNLSVKFYKSHEEGYEDEVKIIDESNKAETDQRVCEAEVESVSTDKFIGQL